MYINCMFFDMQMVISKKIINKDNKHNIIVIAMFKLDSLDSHVLCICTLLNFKRKSSSYSSSYINHTYMSLCNM